MKIKRVRAPAQDPQTAEFVKGWVLAAMIATTIAVCGIAAVGVDYGFNAERLSSARAHKIAQRG